ncbi:P-loop containing nucleoside triphosphate hydrolases superfamily protein [Euphorbia peplus]|nr:P-loop containing nucleoside triphosphate hydrolases superfamily protein [Euphorbia peplus]
MLILLLLQMTKKPQLNKNKNMKKKKHHLSRELEVTRRKRSNAYKQVLHSYDQLQIGADKNLNDANTKILSYVPGGWMEKAGGMKLQDYNVPETTTLLLVGPKGSGKSSLVNRISKVFEDDKFAPDRAQVSYNYFVGDGTFFLQEYMIPRGSTSFCLYDTRSLSGDSSDNDEMLKDWITKGVHHGELITRKSDRSSLRTWMKCKARRNGNRSKETRMVNFVIYVVNGLEFLNYVDNEAGGTAYAQMIATTFNCPYLSFRDDLPVVVVTHGDLLSLPDRARVRVHLGELLGIPPATQIFDIPETSDPVTELTIVEMLRYSLEHADKNLPPKAWIAKKVCGLAISSSAFEYFLVMIGVVIMSIIMKMQLKCIRHVPKSNVDIDWRSIRHV